MILKVERESGVSSLWDNLSGVSLYKAVCNREPDWNDPDAPVPEQYGVVKDRFSKQEKLELRGPPRHSVLLNGKSNEQNDVITHDGWWVSAVIKDSNEVLTVFFDTIGYLLNDEGKTIEVLR